MSPDLDLRLPWPFWWRLLRELRRRGGGVRESGAFLLGRRSGRASTAREFIPYDDVDPDALSTGIVRLSGHAMNAVWERCDRAGLEVLADVHTHPGEAGQSSSDRDYPMVATQSHVALIIPHFARRALDLAGVGHYRYRGARRWDMLSPPRPGLLYVNFRGAS